MQKTVFTIISDIQKGLFDELEELNTKFENGDITPKELKDKVKEFRKCSNSIAQVLNMIQDYCQEHSGEMINQEEMMKVIQERINQKQNGTKKIDMNKVTEKYAQVLDYISEAEKILTEELIPLLPECAYNENSVEKVADDFIAVAEDVAECIMAEAATQINNGEQS